MNIEVTPKQIRILIYALSNRIEVLYGQLARTATRDLEHYASLQSKVDKAHCLRTYLLTSCPPKSAPLTSCTPATPAKTHPPGNHQGRLRGPLKPNC